MAYLFRLIFGRRWGRIISGIVFILLGLLEILITPDWFYGLILIALGILFIVLGIRSAPRGKPGQFGVSAPYPQQPGMPYGQPPYGAAYGQPQYPQQQPGMPYAQSPYPQQPGAPYGQSSYPQQPGQAYGQPQYPQQPGSGYGQPPYYPQ